MLAGLEPPAAGTSIADLSISKGDKLDQVLKREGFDRYVTEQERMEFLAVLLREATLIQVDVHIGACRDPKDNKFLELAVSGQADCIVRGDQDMLVLHPFHGMPIVTPRGFVDEEWKKEE